MPIVPSRGRLKCAIPSFPPRGVSARATRSRPRDEAILGATDPDGVGACDLCPLLPAVFVLHACMGTYAEWREEDVGQEGNECGGLHEGDQLLLEKLGGEEGDTSHFGEEVSCAHK
jgi:hypothetical protein